MILGQNNFNNNIQNTYYYMIIQKKICHNYLLLFFIFLLFICDTVIFYCTHYYAFYGLSYFLLLQFLHNHHKNTWLTGLFLTLEWGFTMHAPHIALLLFIMYKQLSRACNAYLYTSPSIPIALCITGWAICVGTLKIYTGSWPFALTSNFVAKALSANIVVIIILNMLYYYYGKQGNR